MRKPMITRTIATTVVTARVYNKETGEMLECTDTHTRLPDEPAKKVAALIAFYEARGFTYLATVDSVSMTKKYAVTERDFIEIAKVLD